MLNILNISYYTCNRHSQLGKHFSETQFSHFMQCFPSNCQLQVQVSRVLHEAFTCLPVLHYGITLSFYTQQCLRVLSLHPSAYPGSTSPVSNRLVQRRPGRKGPACGTAQNHHHLHHHPYHPHPTQQHPQEQASDQGLVWHHAVFIPLVHDLVKRILNAFLGRIEYEHG